MNQLLDGHRRYIYLVRCLNVDRKMSTMKTSIVKMSTAKCRQARCRQGRCRQIQMSTSKDVECKMSTRRSSTKRNVDAKIVDKQTVVSNLKVEFNWNFKFQVSLSSSPSLCFPPSPSLCFPPSPSLCSPLSSPSLESWTLKFQVSIEFNFQVWYVCPSSISFFSQFSTFLPVDIFYIDILLFDNLLSRHFALSTFF